MWTFYLRKLFQHFFFVLFSKRFRPEYLFYLTLLYYAVITFFNLNNQFILLLTIGLLISLSIKLRSFLLSLLMCYLISFVIFVGKSYPIQIFPPGVLPVDIFPHGLLISFDITPRLILSCLIVVALLREVALRRVRPRHPAFFLLAVFYYFWPAVSDGLVSTNIELSLLASFRGMFIPFILLSFQHKSVQIKKFFLPILMGVLVFESALAFAQLFAGSPLGKNIEYQKGMEYFGVSADERNLSFRSLGTFAHANEFGLWLAVVLALTLPFVIELFYQMKKNASASRHTTRIAKQYVKQYIVGYCCGLLALILTLSRSAWIGFTASLLSVVYFYEKKFVKQSHVLLQAFQWKLVLPFLFIGLFFALPRIERSSDSFFDGGWQFRNLQLNETFDLIYKHPLFGVGSFMQVIEAIRQNPHGFFAQTGLSTHNWYLLTLTEHGVIHLALYTVLLLWVVKKTCRPLTQKSVQGGSVMSIAIISGLVASLVISLFQPFSGELIPLIVFSIFLGSPQEVEKQNI